MIGFFCQSRVLIQENNFFFSSTKSSQMIDGGLEKCQFSLAGDCILLHPLMG